MGDYRRKLYGSKLPADFFDHSNDEFMSKRLQACDMALKDLTEFMKEDGVRVGVLDSTNSNSKRRAHIRDALKNLECKVVVFESIVDKEEVSFIVTFLLFWGNQLIVISLREPRLLSPTFVTFT